MSETLALCADFAPQSLADWRRLAGKALRGADFGSLCSETADGIPVEPLYPAATGRAALNRRPGGAWAIVQPVDHPDAEAAAAQVERDLEGGATGLSLRFAGALAAWGFGLPFSRNALARILDRIGERSPQIRLEPHPRSDQVAAWMLGRAGRAPGRAVSFCLDPVGTLAVAGADTCPPAELARIAAELRSAGFAGPFFEADGRVWHEAGATEAEELGAVVAAIVHDLRLLGEGVDPASAFAMIGVSLAVDCDQFLGLAKLRAMRLLWARLQALCGVPPSPCRIHAETSRRATTAADPHGNLLRGTIAAFAAAAGGADSVTVLPFTAAVGLPERFARRVARNTQHLLLEEAHVGAVADPAAGSGALEALTDALAERAWDAFRAIEAEGGIDESLRRGLLQARIAKSAERLRLAVGSGARAIVGVTAFPNPQPVQAPVEPFEASAPEPAPHRTAEPLAFVRLETFAPAARAEERA
ncbi:methylmalonyl-CoA mutase family protein [Propylenella binzhouense]|uniref:Methylmalonyl-CoA mutase n=1 Tax=Propylenella binzhouense TaxID=2555902 RepID=A0A964T4V8_9HYPH|nr:methylmalonyl-CoA mutase family protein [Propylenella binzhouense]MYZ48399.1 methylmalonyl-CoA mutase [Propylenella binzhouense]